MSHFYFESLQLIFKQITTLKDKSFCFILILQLLKLLNMTISNCLKWMILLIWVFLLKIYKSLFCFLLVWTHFKEWLITKDFRYFVKKTNLSLRNYSILIYTIWFVSFTNWKEVAIRMITGYLNRKWRKPNN